jgi:hypothetical protein
MQMSTDAAIIFGREVFGEPKKYAKTTLERSGNAFGASRALRQPHRPHRRDHAEEGSADRRRLHQLPLQVFAEVRRTGLEEIRCW